MYLFLVTCVDASIFTELAKLLSFDFFFLFITFYMRCPLKMIAEKEKANTIFFCSIFLWNETIASMICGAKNSFQEEKHFIVNKNYISTKSRVNIFLLNCKIDCVVTGMKWNINFLKEKHFDKVNWKLMNSSKSINVM